MGTPEGDDGVGAADSPEHAGLFESRTDRGFASGFDDAGADEQMLLAELGVAHSFGVGFKVIRLGAKLFQNVGMGAIGSA